MAWLQRVLALSTMSLSLVIGTASASASSGTITLGQADASWSTADLAGAMTWTDCTGDCSWIPILTVQPSLPSYACDGSQALDDDPNTQVVWDGGTQSGNGTVSFSLTATPILRGVQGQRVCELVIETTHFPDPVCVEDAPILGMDPADCPIDAFNSFHSVGGALLTQAPPPPPPPVTEPAPAPSPQPQPTPSPKLSAPPKKTIAPPKRTVVCGSIAGPHRKKLPVVVAHGSLRCSIARGAMRRFLPVHGRGKQRFKLGGHRWFCADAHGSELRMGAIAHCRSGRTTVQALKPRR